MSVLKKIPLLKPPEAGVKKNWVFFIRATIVTCLINATMLVQLGQGAPRVKLSNVQVGVIALLAAAVSMSFIYAICSVTFFPLPFGVLASAPPDVLVMAIGFIRVFGPRVRADPSLLTEIKQQISVINGQNWISRALADCDDLKPQSVIFIVEVVNALYVSNALQSASSWILTALVMGIDLAQFWLSMLDVLATLNDVKVLMAKIPGGHPLTQENFLQLAIRILAVDEGSTGHKRKQHQEDSVNILTNNETPIERFASYEYSSSTDLKSLDEGRSPTLTSSSLPNKTGGTRLLSDKRRVVPVHTLKQKTSSVKDTKPIPKITIATSDAADIKSLFSVEERARFIKKSTLVLFITEYVVLVEYVEVVLPIVYGTIHFAVYINRIFSFCQPCSHLSHHSLLFAERYLLRFHDQCFDASTISVHSECSRLQLT
ncbi:unnamed protein product [Phytophthora lilii]|uniref:Unnamed protein product n=1 Tax=Phytophthora lilii TaxID=2077276 RepID=A0A9W6TWY8_9STRA|nr:unnamed protein product [Phytophthora lilii]